MRILLDENLPEGLIEPLRHLGHIVDSVGVILTVIRQQPEAQFVAAFMAAFVGTDWSTVAPVSQWPPQEDAGG